MRIPVRAVAPPASDPPSALSALSLRSLHQWHFEHSHLGIAIHRNGRLVEANEAYVGLFGYSRDELAKLDVHDLSHPDDLQESLHQLKRLAADETRFFTQEKRYIRADGDVFHARVGVVGDRNPEDGALYTIITIEDVSAQVRAEELLRRVVQGVSAATGSTFFFDLVRELGRHIVADNIMVGESVADGRIRAVATYGPDLPVGLEYDSSLTPCGRVLRGNETLLREGLQSHLRPGAPLRGTDIDRYLGMTLHDSVGRPIGVFGIYNRRPFEDLETFLPIIRIFASRAAAELDRLRTERARSQSEQNYRTIFDGVPVCITEHDLSGTIPILDSLRESGVHDLHEHFDRHGDDLLALLETVRTVDANPEAVRMFDAESKSELMRRFRELYRAENAAGLIDLLQALLEGRSVWEGESVYCSLTGRRIHALVRAIYTGRTEGSHRIFASRMDITERKRIEGEIRTSERMLARSQEMAAIGSFEWNTQTGNLIWSDELCRIFGKQKSDLSGSIVDFNDSLHPQDRESVLAAIERAMQGEAVQELEERIIRPDGEIRILRSQLEAIHAAGSLVGLRGVCRDVTEQRQNEDERARLEQQLLHVQKLESLGVLAGGIAHDFNNLLTGILANAELIRLDLDADSPSRDRAVDITTGALAAADLCTQMLAYAGQGSTERRRIDLNQVVSEISHLLEVALPKKASIDRVLADHPLTIHADSTQMRQVVMNLVTNAAESIGDSAGQVFLRTSLMDFDPTHREDTVIPADPPPGRYVCLEVADTGSGMDAETQKKIFDPFFSTKFAGRGLGLATVFGIVRDHGGAILVSSSPGQGTSLRVVLPHADPAESITEVSADVPGSLDTSDPKGEGWVLVADDEPAVRSVVRAILGRAGFGVLEASDGRECRHLWNRYRTRLRFIVLDATMAHLGGLEVLSAIRKEDRQIPVLLMSGSLTPRYQLDPLDRNTHFLRKPFQVAAFRRALRSWMEDTPPIHDSTP